MGAPSMQTFPILTDTGGDYTADGPPISGAAVQLRYVRDTGAPLDTGADLSIVSIRTGLEIFDQADCLGASFTRQLDGVVLASESVRVTVDGSANGVKQGTLYLWSTEDAGGGEGGGATTGTLGHGVKVVAAAGTDEVLAPSTACKWVMIQAQTDNTSKVAVGASGVDATVATGNGILLDPGDVVTIPCDNLRDVYVDALVSGEGVRYVYGV